MVEEENTKEFEKQSKIPKKKTISLLSKPSKGAVKNRRIIFRRFSPYPNYTKEQMVLGELFGGGRTFGTGQNLPKLNRTITSGGGLIKNDDYGDTGRLFGLR